MRCFKLLLMGGIVLALTVPAAGLTFNQPYQGPIDLKLYNYDNGTVYPTYDVGVTQGVACNPAQGVPAMDALGGTLPAGGMTGAGWWPQVSIGTSEDSWGILKLTEIYGKDAQGDLLLWSNATSNTEVTAIFYGVEDYFLEQTYSNVQLIDSVNMHVDLWEEPKTGLGVTPLDPSQGSGNRTGLAAYTSATEGTLILQLDSVPGFLHPAGEAGGSCAEFETRYNAGAFTGDGDAYFDVVGGTMAQYFDTDTIWNPNAQANFDAGWTPSPTCDFSVAFDATETIVGPNPSGADPIGLPPYDWLVETDDPFRGNIVPEPITMAGLLLGIGCLGRYVRRRR